ncbi:hypothetical protein PMAYCL1PPCAC_11545, partial [Pristionchus mayeri]
RMPEEDDREGRDFEEEAQEVLEDNDVQQWQALAHALADEVEDAEREEQRANRRREEELRRYLRHYELVMGDEYPFHEEEAAEGEVDEREVDRDPIDDEMEAVIQREWDDFVPNYRAAVRHERLAMAEEVRRGEGWDELLIDDEQEEAIIERQRDRFFRGRRMQIRIREEEARREAELVHAGGRIVFEVLNVVEREGEEGGMAAELQPAEVHHDQGPLPEHQVRVRAGDGEDWLQLHPRPANPDPMNPLHRHFWPDGFIPPGIVPPPVPPQMDAVPPPPPQPIHPPYIPPNDPIPVPLHHLYLHHQLHAHHHHHHPHPPHHPYQLPPAQPIRVPPRDLPPFGGVAMPPHLPPPPPPPHIPQFHVYIRGVVQHHDEDGQMTGGGGTVVTPELIKEATRLKEEDARNDPSPIRYSRACPVCAIENPQKRAVFVQCGHIICLPCAVSNATSEGTAGKCVKCRAAGGFIKMFEDEDEENGNG